MTLRRSLTTLSASLGLLVPVLALAPPAAAARVAGEFTYVHDTALVPAGATVAVHVTSPSSGKTVVTLHVRGLKAHHEYGAHAHVNDCGAAPSAAGGHYQYVVGGPVTPENEIWLDLTTNASGNGSTQTVVDWQFTADRRAQSVVVHEHGSTVPGGNPRAACLTVAF